jgi:tetratricopeptide (TPR) repeat protein
MRVLKQGARLANRYTLVRRLGSGGMSETWLAEDLQTAKPVALKFLSTRLATNAEYRKRFHKEWQIGSRLMHANIVRVFEYYDDDEPFYSLQYLAGPDISVITGEPVELVLRPIGLIVDALRYAHGKNVVHRDIKASNILLDSRGVPYLIDFGVAGNADQPAGGGSAIASSPQQLAGEPARAEDDIYALGVLMHELIGGRPPATDADAAGLTAPTSVRALVTEMLARDPAMRPDAESVGDRLREAGFAPGLVPARFTGGAFETDVEPVEATIRPRQPRIGPQARAAAEPEDESGISLRLVGGALVGALVLFLVVVFLLPKVVIDREPSAGRPGTAGSGPRIETTDDEDDVLFNENIEDFMTPDERVILKTETEESLGELLSKLETLEARAVERWGGQEFKHAQEVYAEGDRHYLSQNFRLAGERYREAITIIDPLLDRVDGIFEEAMESGQQALEAGDSDEALRLFELAVAMSPGHAEAHNGLARAKNLDLVMSLTRQGVDHEKNLDLEAARLAFDKALELDAEWLPAKEGLERVLLAGNQLSFDQRMSEGLNALADGDFQTARAAFRTAQALQPESREPADGLLQVDQGIRLQRIATMENEAKRLEANEQWDAAVDTYKAILEVDADLVFAQEGLARASERAELHETLEGYIADPDSLADPAKTQAATKMLLDITRMESVGPRLTDQKNQLSRLLKRAVTPLTVRLISDNATDVVIFRVGKLGTFESQEISLRPGKYVAVGSRPGYRDVRLEFRVSPETELQPIVVRCEERI